MTSAANLDRQAIIEKKSVTRDATYGTEQVTWVPFDGGTGLVWLNVADVPPSRSESVAQNLPLARNQTKFTMRWRSDLDSSMRIRLLDDSSGGTVYQIIGGPAMVGGRKQFLEIVGERYSS